MDPAAPPLRWRIPALWALGSALLSLVVLGPNVPWFGTHLLGYADSDAPKHLWGQWVVREAVLAGEGISNQLTMANHPDGGRFVILDTGVALLSLPLAWVVSPFTAYDLTVLVQLSLVGLCTFLAARALTGSEPGAFVAAAVVVVSAPLVATGLVSGVAETQSLWPLPLLLLASLRTLQQPDSLRWPLAASGLLMLQAFLCWSYAAHAELLLPVLLLLSLAGGGRAGLVPGRRLDRRLLRQGLAFLVPLAVPIGLLWWRVSDSVNAADATYSRGVSLFPGAHSAERLEHVTGASLWGLVRPGEDALRVLDHSVDYLVKSDYLGIVVVLAAAWAAWRSPRARRLLGGALVVGILALGPRLDLVDGGASLPNLAYLAAWQVVPLFHETAHTHGRLLVTTSLLLGFVLAAGVASLPAARQSLAGIVLGGLVLADGLFVSPAPWPVPHAPVAPDSSSLYLAGEEGGILELPFGTDGGRFRSRLFREQIWHGRPLPFTLEGVGLGLLSPTVRMVPFVQETLKLVDGHRSEAPCGRVARLREADIHWVRLWPELLAPERADRVAQHLDACLGEPLMVSTLARLYRVDADASGNTRGDSRGDSGGGARRSPSAPGPAAASALAPGTQLLHRGPQGPHGRQPQGSGGEVGQDPPGRGVEQGP